jgi:hypothetical protein
MAHLRLTLAAGQESVTFKCDPAKADPTEACPPSGLLQWDCSEDCPDAECDINFGGFGLFGTIPEIGDLRCAHRFARVYAPRPRAAAAPPRSVRGPSACSASLASHGRVILTTAELAVL